MRVLLLQFGLNGFALFGKVGNPRAELFARRGFLTERDLNFLDAFARVVELRLRLTRRGVVAGLFRNELIRLKRVSARLRRPFGDLARLDFDRRFFRDNLLARRRERRFEFAQFLFRVGELRGELRLFRFRRLNFAGAVGFEFRIVVRFGVELVAFGRLEPPFVKTYFGPQLLEPRRIEPVIFRLCGLRFCFAELPFDFADDIGEPEQILFDAFEPARDFLLFRVEPGDARRLFEHGAPLDTGALQKRFDAPLFDNGVALRAEPRPADEIAEIFETARLPVNEIFGFAASIDAAREVDFVGVEREPALAVVERERNFRGSERGPGRRAVKDDVGHFVAAEPFRALFPQRPFNSVDYVRFARTVRTDERADAFVEFEARSIGKTFETVQFDRF